MSDTSSQLAAPLQARQPRKNLLLAATIESGALKAPVRIRNLSESGALLDGAALPATGAMLTLRRGEIEMGAMAMWSAGGRCGVRFDGAVAVEEWVAGKRIPGADRQGQARVDAIQSAIRGGEAPMPESAPLTAPATVGGDALERRIAEELLYVRRLLDVVGDGLTDDPIVLQRHTVALQNLDAASQILAHLGAILEAGDRRAAVEAVTMHDLKTRLQRKALF